jgi:hypothetical protein
MAVGNIVTIPEVPKITTGEVVKAKPSLYGEILRHNLSGYWQCSGAMIAFFEDGNIELPCVLGVCEFNIFHNGHDKIH